MITAAQLRRIRPGTAPADAEVAARVLSVAAAEHGITTRLRLAAWLANIAQESGFRNVREDLYYRDPTRIANIFRTAFQGSAAAARPYVLNPVALANRAYAHRLGNGSEASGDGHRYRGGGYIQLTGRAMYRAHSRPGLNLEAHPELIEDPQVSARVAASYWQRCGANAAADAGDIDRTRALVNGPAMLHRDEVRVFYRRALQALPAQVTPPPRRPPVPHHGPRPPRCGCRCATRRASPFPASW
ncbi:glycoside hydrolase family 19 protein [Deinococcus multiflagellatus]|uniref:Glycoside hydrolase family 19 protein n=2 Tax=Deinococcus multiflagellatus TaxID=1656887 RepID=A0ABW1ZR24_9DEIO